MGVDVVSGETPAESFLRAAASPRNKAVRKSGPFWYQNLERVVVFNIEGIDDARDHGISLPSVLPGERLNLPTPFLLLQLRADYLLTVWEDEGKDMILASLVHKTENKNWEPISVTTAVARQLSGDTFAETRFLWDGAKQDFVPLGEVDEKIITACELVTIDVINFLVWLAAPGTEVWVEAAGADAAANRKRIKRNKRPLFERRTLVIDPTKAKARSVRQGGTHASPRLHLRRGHWRRYKSGKTVWIEACKVGKPELGVVAKTYQLETSPASL